MPKTPFKPLYDGEPRGDNHGEPRDDGLNLVIEDGGDRYWQNPNGTRVCGARCSTWKETWKRCGQTGIMTNKRCHLHGGKTPSGAANPSFKTGRHSKHLPRGFADRYEEFLDDPELTTLRPEIALVDTRLSMILAGLDERTSTELWDAVRTAYHAVRTAINDQDPDRTSAALNEMGHVIARGVEQSQIWEEAANVIDQRRKLVDTENRRIKQSAQTLSVEDAMMIVQFITETVLRVMDRYDVPRQARQEIADATRHLFTN